MPSDANLNAPGVPLLFQATAETIRQALDMLADAVIRPEHWDLRDMEARQDGKTTFCFIYIGRKKRKRSARPSAQPVVNQES